MKKKVLSLLLAVTLMFSVLPMSAFASETENTESGTEIIKTIDASAADAGDINDNTDDTDGITGDGGGGLFLADSGDDSCTCASFCSDADCVVCKDDATQCFYYYCICEAVCVEGEANPDCPVCKDDYSKCAQAVESPEIAPLAVATVEEIPVGGYVTSGDGEITISGLPNDGSPYVYLVMSDAWPGWQNTSQAQSANMDMWTIWTESVDVTITFDETALENGTTYYVYIAKTELINTSYAMRSLGEAVVTPSNNYTPPASPATTSSSSGSSGGSSKQDKPAPSAPAIAPMDNKSSGTLNNAIDSAAKAATNSNGKDLGVRLKNVSNFTKENAAAIIKKAKALGKKATVSSDIMSEDGKFVEVRVTLDPELITKTVRLDGYIRQSQILIIESKFKKHFDNKTAFVHLGQEGKFGQTAKIAAQVDLTGFDTANLYIYSYDRKTNKYTLITSTDYKIDKNGYIVFNTELGGDIIVSDGALVKK